MSDEPQPLRLKPRLPSAGGLPPAPEPPPPPAAGAEPADATSRLRLKPRLSLPEETPAQSAPAPFVPPPPPPSGSIPIPELAAIADPEPDEAVPKFKLRPKAAPAAAKPQALAEGVPPPPPPPPVPLPPMRMPVPEEPPPPPDRPSALLPPMSILAAPLPPALGAPVEAPAPPGSIPRLSLSTTPDKPPAVKGSLGRLADKLPKIGGKKIAVKPGKTASVLRRRAALSPMAKVGLTVVFICIAVGGFYSYRIFFPEQLPIVKIRLVAKPVGVPDAKKSDALPKGAGVPGQPADKGKDAVGTQRGDDQAKADGTGNGQDEPTVTPTPTPVTDITESVMGDASISKDVKVGNTPIDAAPAASAAFRAFVASATIGGVFQGAPAKALINGTVFREGQTVDSQLGVVFGHIDADKKVIYFKDYTGAVVSKNY